MKKYLKAAAVLLSLSIAGSTSVFAQEGINLSYSADTYTFSISGKAEKAREPVYLQIYPFERYKDSYEFVSAQELEEGKTAIVKTALSSLDRIVDISVIIPSDGSIPAGRYIYKAASYQYDKSGIMIVASSGLFTDSIKSKVNSSSTSEIISALKDDSLVPVLDDSNTAEEKYTYLAECIKNMKPDGGYDVQSFINSYLIAEGLYNLSADNMTIKEMLEFYSIAYDADYLTQYEALDTQAQAAVASLFKSNAIQSSFSKEFADNIFASDYYVTTTSAKLKELVLEYVNENSISLSDYNKLNSQRKENVFTYLYNQKNSLVSAGTIVECFKGAVSSELEKQTPDPEEEDFGGNTGGGGGGGGGDTTIINTIPPVVQSEKFIDMTNHWSKDAVYKMADAGYINGYTDKTFRPDNNITRSEFVKILCTAFEISGSGAHSFTDVVSGSWYEQYVAAAASAGLVQGSEGKFNPESLITRQDAAVIIKRLLDMKQVSVNTANANYDDYNTIAQYAREAVNALSNLGLMKGYNGNVNPLGNLTRAEAATLLSRCADAVK